MTVRGETDGGRRASTGRCRCGSTCWSASGCSTCSTTRTRPQQARRAPGAAALHPRDRPAGWTASDGRGRGRPRAGATARRYRAGRRRAARPRRAAAGDRLHLQPGRLRRRRAAVPAGRAAADRRRTSATEIRALVEARTAAHPGRGPRRPRLLGVARRPGARPRRPPRRACCRRSRRSSRSCSSAGLVKAVFATETLALGINMPARSVVLERLVKWNGEAHVDLTPGEYTQLTGRAGRRGIDVEGHAVVLWAPEARPAARRRPRLDPHLPAAVELPAVVQHGGQPGRLGRRGARPRAAGVVVRAVPGRPGGGRAGPAGAAQRARPLAGYDDRDGAATAATSREYFALRQAIAEREKALARHGVAGPARRGR